MQPERRRLRHEARLLESGQHLARIRHFRARVYPRLRQPGHGRRSEEHAQLGQHPRAHPLRRPLQARARNRAKQQPPTEPDRSTIPQLENHVRQVHAVHSGILHGHHVPAAPLGRDAGVHDALLPRDDREVSRGSRGGFDVVLHVPVLVSAGGVAAEAAGRGRVSVHEGESGDCSAPTRAAETCGEYCQ